MTHEPDQTPKKAPKKAPKKTERPRGPVKLRAMQTLLYDERLIKEGEVFLYDGADLPAEEIAVRVSASEPLGAPPETPGTVDPPHWTTKGYVDQAIEERGARGA